MFDRINQLRKRKLAQWALGYIAGAWLLLEVFAFVADRFGWPGWLIRGATILLGIGFLLTVILAWYHGEQGRQQFSRTEMAWITAVVIGGGALLWGSVSGPDPEAGLREGSATHEHEGATRFLMMLPAGETLTGTETALAISRDGRRIAYVAGQGDTSHLFVRELDSFEATAIPGTEGARAPFFSPDGEWVGFFAGGSVKKVALAGGSPQTLVEDAWSVRWEYVLSGSWGADDVLFLSFPREELGSLIWRVSAQGGTPVPLTQVDWEESYFLPQLLPGGEHILFSAWNHSGTSRIMALDLETGEELVLLDEGGEARYLETGHLVFLLNGDLMTAPFDPEGPAVTGVAVPAVEGVMAGEYGTAQYSISGNGNLAYVPAGVDQIERTLVWMDLAGHMEVIPGSLTDSYTPRLSPGGDQVIFQRRPDLNLWLMDLERGSVGRVTEHDAPEFWHVWTPDGESVVYNSNPDGGEWLNLWMKQVGGTGPPMRLTSANHHQMPQSWTPDGETLVFTQGVDSETGVDILTVRVPPDWTGETVIQPDFLLRTEADEYHPALSPNGEWIAYVSNASGQGEVFVAPFPGPGPRTQVSTEGGWEPSWSPDGRTLYFRSLGDRQLSRQMFAVSVDWDGARGERTLDLGNPRVLFDGPFFQCSEWGRSYDLSPEGDRFLMVQDQRPGLTATQINVVVNWFSELPSN